MCTSKFDINIDVHFDARTLSVMPVLLTKSERDNTNGKMLQPAPHYVLLNKRKTHKSKKLRQSDL